MRSILVYADRGPGMLNRLDAALSLARAQGGHVSVLVDTPVRSFIAMDPMGGSHIASEALTQAIADDDTYAHAIEAQLSAEKVPFRVIRSEDDRLKALILAARLADVVILSRTPDMAGDLAVGVRMPVLVLPDEAAVALPPRTACVAWDGGEEAAHALRAAAPLLRGCAKVHILTVGDGGDDQVGAEAVDYLGWYGVTAELHALAADGPAEKVLSAAVERLGGDMLVLGAYGHSRVREYLFGGTTRHFLEDCPGLTLLLAH